MKDKHKVVKETKEADLTANKEQEVTKEMVDKLLKNEFTLDINSDEHSEETPVAKEEVQEVVEEVQEVQEVEEEIKDVEYNKIKFPARGFKTLNDAIDFMSTEQFKKLGEADKEEYKNWLIKK